MKNLIYIVVAVCLAVVVTRAVQKRLDTTQIEAALNEAKVARETAQLTIDAFAQAMDSADKKVQEAESLAKRARAGAAAADAQPVHDSADAKLVAQYQSAYHTMEQAYHAQREANEILTAQIIQAQDSLVKIQEALDHLSSATTSFVRQQKPSFWRKLAPTVVLGVQAGVGAGGPYSGVGVTIGWKL